MRALTTVAAVLSAVVLTACGQSDSGVPITRSDRAQVCRGVEKTQNGFRAVGEFDARRVLGMTVADGRRVAQEHGCDITVLTEVDGTVARTADLMRSRINAWVERGRIVRIDSIG